MDLFYVSLKDDNMSRRSQKLGVNHWYCLLQIHHNLQKGSKIYEMKHDF